MLIGASGLVGQEVLHLALADPRVNLVVAPTRKALPARSKLENPVIDFDQLPADAPWWAVDAVICTLGTTIGKAGSQEAFRKVDHTYPLACGRLARDRGATAFALNSSLGANADSGNFYLRTKGEVERDLAALGYASLTLVRPSVIGGERNESRPAETLSKVLLNLVRPLVPKRYRVVPAVAIAETLLESALAAKAGTTVIESEEISASTRGAL